MDSPEQNARGCAVQKPGGARPWPWSRPIAAGIELAGARAPAIEPPGTCRRPAACMGSARSGWPGNPRDFQGWVDLAAASSTPTPRAGCRDRIDPDGAPPCPGSALSIAWPGSTHQVVGSDHRFFQGDHPGTSLLANALVPARPPQRPRRKCCTPLVTKPRMNLAQLLRRRVLGWHASGLVDVGWTMPVALRPRPDRQSAAQSAGRLRVARQALLAGWTRPSRPRHARRSKWPNICLADDDPVSAVEALKHAVASAVAERQARLAILLAKSGLRRGGARRTADSPEKIEETVAKAVVASLRRREHAAEAARRAAEECETIEALSPHRLEGLAEVLERHRPGLGGCAGSLSSTWPAAAPGAASACGWPSRRSPRGQPDVPPCTPAPQPNSSRIDGRSPHRGPCARAPGARGSPFRIGCAIQFAPPRMLDPESAPAVRLSTPAGWTWATRVSAETLARSKGASAVSLALLGRALMAAGRTVEARESPRSRGAPPTRRVRSPGRGRTPGGARRPAGRRHHAGFRCAGCAGQWPGPARLRRLASRRGPCQRGSGRPPPGQPEDPNADAAWLLEYGELLVELGHYDLGHGHAASAAGQAPGRLASPPRCWRKRCSAAARPPRPATLVGPLPAEADVEARTFAGHVLVSHAASAGDTHSARKAFELLRPSLTSSPRPRLR